MVHASVEARLDPWLGSGGQARGAAALPPSAGAIAGAAVEGRSGAAVAVDAAGHAEVLAAELAGEGALAGGHADGAGRRQE